MSDKVQITIKNKVGEKYADLQTKIVTPSKETQVITADEGYYGLEEVIVSATPFNNDDVVEEINDVKVMLTDGDATPEDIKLGKTAYVKGEKLVGTYEISGTLDITENGVYNVTDYATANVQTESTLKKFLDYVKICNSWLTSCSITDLTGYIEYEDTSNVTSMYSMCSNNNTLVTVPPLNTRNVTNMGYIFMYCNKLRTVGELDVRSLTYCFNMFSGCTQLRNVTLLNIKLDLQVGSGSSWGHLLTLESLLGLCQECVNVGESRTLTIGSYNINKLANVYVKLTGEPEEDETLPKLPMVQCESTDEGAMTITDYMLLKNWSLA